jgi:hypothetical protein
LKGVQSLLDGDAGSFIHSTFPEREKYLLIVAKDVIADILALLQKSKYEE